MTELVTRELPADGVPRLAINRPDQHNAISLEVQRSIDAAVIDAAVIDAAGDPAVRCLLLTSRTVDGAEAFRLGLLSRLVADDEVPAAARQLAGEVAAHDPAAVREVKRLLLAGPGRDTRARYDAENTAMRTTPRPRAMTEVFRSFLTRARGRAED